MEASDKLAGQGERVLALAWIENPDVKAGGLTPADLPRNLILLGLVGLLDPPRKEAIEAVKECQDGGIRVTMITGDHKITAAAIAKLLGIGDGKTAIAGAEIEKMDTATLQERVRDVDVFARASPEHKLRLVKAIQANNQIVAMTGDGVNDAPALKKADIGVAMGIKGTEVTKEAAEMILVDDNFASITAAVKEGRTVYNNIEKAILFMLPTNVAQALVIAVAILFGFTMPITAPQVLWVNMVTSVALGLVISFEPHELDVMQRSPRAADRPILTQFGLWRVAFVGVALLAFTLCAFFWMKSQGASDQLARTAAVNAITVGQVFYLLNSRYLLDSSLSLGAHLGNKYLPYGIGAVVLLQMLFTYAPPLQQLFDTQALPLHVWLWLISGGLLFFLVVEAEKLVIRSTKSLRRTVCAVEAGTVSPPHRQSNSGTQRQGDSSWPQSEPATPANRSSSARPMSKELRKLQIELCRLQDWVKHKGLRVIIVFEGRDAAGKGGTIKAITDRVSPRVFRVVALPAPSGREKSQMYFQRYIPHFPAAGEIIIFDRSWYNRAGVEYVMGFCTEEEHRQFLIVCPEVELYIVDSGIMLIKFWLEVGKEEQERRFLARIHDPLRQWKLSPMDIESYKRWYEYSKARDVMLKATHTKFAPWHIVRSDDKRRARLNCISHILKTIAPGKSPRSQVKLPKRSTKGAYDDQARLKRFSFVSEKY